MTHLIKSTLVIALTLCIYASRSGVAHYTDDAISNASSSQQQTHTTRSVLLEQLITAPTKSMCKEACWAQSASDRELRGKYGSAKIPARFKFADRFYRKGVNYVSETCLTMYQRRVLRSVSGGDPPPR